MSVSITFIDAGGHHAQQVYDFARKHVRQKVFAIKGSSLQEGVPIVSPPKRHKTQRIVTYQVGSYTGKEALMRRLLKVKTPESRDERRAFYIHLPLDIDQARLDQFLNEKLMRKIVNGRPRGIWVKTGPNEEIDLFVYAFGGLHALGPAVIDSLDARAKELSEWKKAEAKAAEEDPLALLKRRGKGNWVNEWKRK